jgi:hypothetical protein
MACRFWACGNFGLAVNADTAITDLESASIGPSNLQARMAAADTDVLRDGLLTESTVVFAARQNLLPYLHGILVAIGRLHTHVKIFPLDTWWLVRYPQRNSWD